MAIVSNTVGYLDGDVLLEGFFAYDDEFDGRRPGVIINHAWAGRNAFAEEKAIELAELGYFAFAVDMYGKGITGSNNDECAALMQPFIDDRAMLLKREAAALYAVKLMPWVDDNKIAAIGFCFGGLCVLDLARSGAEILGVVSFHGLLNPPVIEQNDNDIESIKAKVLILNGADDPMVSDEQLLAAQEEFTRVGADWQVHNYGHTMHAFTNPAANDPGFGTVYQADADKRSWQAMQSFLAEIFE